MHEFNDAPRRVLTDQLGFTETGEQEGPPADVAPPSMRRNDAGQVVGDLFRFERPALAEFADWLESYDGAVRGKGGVKTAVRLDVTVADLGGGDLDDLRRLAADDPDPKELASSLI